MKQIAVVTGGTRGIGKAIVKVLIRDGYEVVSWGSKQVDVTDREVVGQEADELRKRYGTIRVLVNNAGIVADRTLMKMTDKEWDKVIDTDLTGLFNVTRELLPLMVTLGGAVVNVASIIGERGGFGQSNYAAAKAGVVGMTKSLAQELAKYQIRVNAVCPGYIATSFVDKIPKERLLMLTERTALKRMGKPIEVAEVVGFLVSEKASFMTGAVVKVDGGFW